MFKTGSMSQCPGVWNFSYTQLHIFVAQDILTLNYKEVVYSSVFKK